MVNLGFLTDTTSDLAYGEVRQVGKKQQREEAFASPQTHPPWAASP